MLQGQRINMEELGNERDQGACCDIPKKTIKMFKNVIRCGLKTSLSGQEHHLLFQRTEA